MVVACPRCKTRLRVPEERIAPQGSRFRCPKCSVVLLVKRPSRKALALDKKKVLVAHPDGEILGQARKALQDMGYQVITASDGVQAMVSTMKEMPFLIVVDVALPKIYGFELAKRLKAREDTKDIKAILISSVYDKRRYRREPASLYGADAYVEDHEIPQSLPQVLREVLEGAPSAKKEPQLRTPQEPPTAPGATTAPPEARDEMVERARRLARTILSDIYLYSPQKVEEAIRNGNFYATFASELKEGMKLYETRIPQEVRQKGDFFREAIEDFIETKKKALGI